MNVIAASFNDTGFHREHNEDRMLVDSTRRLYVVCDGLGGHAGGEIAAELTTSMLQHAHVVDIEVPKRELGDFGFEVWRADAGRLPAHLDSSSTWARDLQGSSVQIGHDAGASRGAQAGDAARADHSV
jgi:hypothetical protein